MRRTPSDNAFDAPAANFAPTKALKLRYTISEIKPETATPNNNANKVILETEIVPDYADKEVRFEDKSMNAMKGEDKIREMLDQVDPTSKGIVFQDFTDEECQKILSTPLKDLKIIEPEIYRKTVIKASEVMPKGKDIRINGMAEYQRELQAMEDKREIRKRAALEKIKNKKYEEFKKAESAERQTSQMNAAPEPEEDEDEMFRQAEEAYQLMQKELKDKEEAFKKGNKFCIDNLSEEDKKLYDIMDEDREELKRAMEIEKSKKPSKNEVNLPEGAKERHGVSSEIWNGLRESRIGLDENRWFSWTGFGTSHELSRLKHQMDRLLDICNKTNERSYDDKYVRLRDEMVDKLEKEAIAYDREKRGKKHLNDPNWEPITSAGQTRFRANKKILEFCKEYKSKYACKDPKILGNASLSDKVVDVLDDKQWAERLGDIDPERKPTDPKEQKKIIKEVEDCTVGILNAKFSNKFIGKNEISEDAAEMFFDVNSEKIQNADVFKRIKNGLKGKDAWEKAMALKKLAEKDGGVKLIETYSQAVIANKKAKKSAPEAVNAQPQANAVKNKKKPTSTKGGI